MPPPARRGPATTDRATFDHSGFRRRIDQLSPPVGEQLERHPARRALDEVAGVLRNSTARVPRGDHGHVDRSGSLDHVDQERFPPTDGGIPRVFSCDQLAGGRNPPATAGESGSETSPAMADPNATGSGSAHTERGMSKCVWAG